MERRVRRKVRWDHIRNEDIGKEAHSKPVETFRENKRLKWFGHCLRREHSHVLCEIAQSGSFGGEGTEVDRERYEGGNIKGDMKKYQLTEDMVQYRKYWMTQNSAHGDGQER